MFSTVFSVSIHFLLLSFQRIPLLPRKLSFLDDQSIELSIYDPVYSHGDNQRYRHGEYHYDG